MHNAGRGCVHLPVNMINSNPDKQIDTYLMNTVAYAKVKWQVCNCYSCPSNINPTLKDT